MNRAQKPGAQPRDTQFLIVLLKDTVTHKPGAKPRATKSVGLGYQCIRSNFRDGDRDKLAGLLAFIGEDDDLVAIGAAVGGGIITESIFSWPGIGRTLLNASLVNDIPLAMGALTVIGVMTLISHLIADIGYVFLDPRIRY